MKIRIALLLLYSTLSLSAVDVQSEWTFLNCIGGCNNLSSYALSNVELMKMGTIPNKINWLVQLDEPMHNQTLRYKIASKQITDNVSTQQPLGLNQKQELIDSLHWASTYPSQYFFLLFWNHGNGILDQSKRWEDYAKRGILYNFNQKTYLTNQDLKEALTHATSKSLGKKIDIIGMDACLMAMLEVAYQIKNYARYLIASQNIEKTPGWNYLKFLNQMNETQQPISPLTCARMIVSTFADLNEWRNNISTLSVIDLNTIDTTKQAVDKMATELTTLLEKHPKQIHELIRTARTASINFEDQHYPYLGYIDFGSFINNLLSLLPETAYASLKNSLRETLTTINASVVHKYAGSEFKDVCGLSIYFPEDKVQPSYLQTDFAQESSWTAFLKKYLQLRTYKFKWPTPLPRKGL